MSGFAIVGLAITVVSETATLRHIEPFWSWNTPIAWTGFIIFADSVVYRARGHSWIRSAPREFAALALVSIPLWLVFEWFNLYLRNWHYVGLPENLIVRYLGYAWAFATIWPAIFEGAELVAVMRAGQAGWAGEAGETPSAPPALPRSAALISGGGVLLTAPFLMPSYAQYLAAPVWLGFILLLDPINARLGTERITRQRLINLSLSGLLCGALWEFWNYWARSKWIYTVPIMENLKIFEMPLPGYLGFPAFALECFTMYVFLRRVITTHGRPIAL